MICKLGRQSGCNPHGQINRILCLGIKEELISFPTNCIDSIYTTLTPQIKGNHRVIYHDIALTTTAFDAEAAIKHQFPLIIYIEMLKVLHCGFELNMLI